MTMAHFWVLFAYITGVLLFQGYHYCFSSQVDAPFTDSKKMRVNPDERGIIGELSDQDGVQYYAVMIPKEEFDREWDKIDEDDGKG